MNKFTDWDTLPLTLTAAMVGTILNISKPCVYNLLNRADFPAFRVERRIIIPRDEFKAWLKKQAGL
jgi:excisionase family DNA binding protein